MTDDHLDRAIDAVAARLTRVEQDDAFAQRIVNALPERSPTYWWAPRLAFTAALAIGVSLVVLRTFDERSTDVLRTENPSAPMAAYPAAAANRTAVELELIVRRTIVEPPQNDRRTTVDVPDFDRSLEAIDALGALSLASVAPSVLPEDAPLTLPPLAIEELPLTAETISPR
jgi:hypothetical protein